MKTIFAILVLSVLSFGQASPPGLALQNSPGNYARVVPNAPVKVCLSTDTAVPCTNTVQTYTDLTMGTQCTLNGNVTGAPLSGTSCNNPGTADSNGNYTFFAASGNYTVCTYTQNWLCEKVSLGGGGGGGSGTILASSTGCNTVYSSASTTTLTGECAVLDASQFSGADWCAKVHAALLALPNGIGTVDARNLAGGQTCSANPYASFTGLSTLLIGSGTITTSAGWVLPSGNRIIGFNGTYNGIPSTSNLQAGVSFPTSTPLISIGGVGNIVQDLSLDCQSVTGCVGIFTSAAQRLKLTNLQLLGLSTGSYGIHLSNFTGNASLDQITSSAASTATASIWIDTASNVSVTNTFLAATSTAGILVSGSTNVNVSDALIENVTTGILVDSGGTKSSTFSTITSTGTTTVQIAASSSNRGLTFLNLFSFATNTLVDSVTSHTLTTAACPSVGFYSLGDAAASPSVISTCGPILPTFSAYSQILSNGTSITQRSTVNFLSGTNATVSCVDNSGASRTDCTVSASAAAGSRLDQISAATASNSINNADNAQVWNWSLTTASKIGLLFSENVASTATGSPFLHAIQTIAGSTANPFRVTAQGTANGWMEDVNGKWTALGSGAFDASASTASNGSIMQVKAGCTSGTDGAVCYDSTGKITHVRTNGADSDVAATTSTTTTTTQALFATATAGLYTPRAIATGDLPGSGATTVNGQSCALNGSCAPSIPSCADSSGSGSVQSCNTSPTFTPNSTTNSCVRYSTTTANTGASLTINVNSLGAKSVAVPGASGFTTTLTTGIIPANIPLVACYDGTNWDFQQTGTSGTGSFTNPMTTLGDIIYENATPAPARLAAPTSPNSVPEVLTSIPSGGVGQAPVWNLAGVPINAQTGASYTILATDRLSRVSLSNASTVAVTLPQAGSTGFGSNFAFVACDIGAGSAIITPTTSTISYSTGGGYTSGASSVTLTTGQCIWVYSDNTNYFGIFVGSGTGAGGTVTSVATTGPITGGTITTSGTIACPTCTFTAGTSDVTAQSTSQSAVTVATSPTAGRYQLQYYADLNTACTTGANSVSFTFNWTDASNARALSTGSLSMGTAQLASSYLSGTIPVQVASGNVTYTSTVAGSCASGTSSYDVHVALIRIQ